MSDIIYPTLNLFLYDLRDGLGENAEEQENHCVFIAFYPDSVTARKASRFNFDWLRLFAYRSKILWSYGQSQYLRNKLKGDFVKIKQYINDFNQAQTRRLNLKKLRRTLVNAQNTLYSYSINLNYLDTQQRTIKTNLLNYRRRLDRIKQRLSEFQAESELEFFVQFAEDVERRYLLQVQTDHENFSPGLSLLENLINSIRGVTEIDQSERDRNFQEIVAILGVGLATGALAATSAEQFPSISNPTQATKYPVGSALTQLGIPEPWLPPAILITVSSSTVILFALLTAIVIKLNWFFRR